MEKVDLEKILSSERLKFNNCNLTISNDETAPEYVKIRNPFQRDYDRVIFSASFRKLGGKTQVHPLADNDTIHTRLTHSLETASVGRSLGLIVYNGLKEKGYINETIKDVDIATIVQTACLLHDLGNPPFGHAGENAISNWFSELLELKKDENSSYLIDNLEKKYKNELKNFDGNAQGFRLATKLENNFNKDGMNLTLATLSSMVKYPFFISNEAKKSSIFFTEKDIFDKIFTHLELFVEDKNKEKKYIRNPFSFLMEAADDICYTLIDIVDAVELQIIKLEDTIDLYRQIIDGDKIDKTLNNTTLNDTRKISRLTAIAINELTLCAGNLFINNIDRFLDKNEIQKIDNLISLDKVLSESINKLKKFALENIFSEKNKNKLEISANKILGDLLNYFVEAVIDLDKNDENKISVKSKQILYIMGIYRPEKSMSLYEKLRCTVDFISGMTDRYATNLFQQLSGISFQFRRI